MDLTALAGLLLAPALLADVVVAPYPSDHRAVVAEVELPADESPRKYHP